MQNNRGMQDRTEKPTIKGMAVLTAPLVLSELWV